jgi:hypothetical protein
MAQTRGRKPGEAGAGKRFMMIGDRRTVRRTTALSRADFIFEIAISPWKSGLETGLDESLSKSMR